MNSPVPSETTKINAKEPQYSFGVLGPAGSFSEEAIFSFFKNVDIRYYNSIPEVISASAEEKSISKIDFGVVPLENLIHGPVTETLDSLTKIYLEKDDQTERIEILMTFSIPIEHWIGIPKSFPDNASLEGLSHVKKVYSHPQALAQSRDFISKYLPNSEQCITASTSISPLSALESKQLSAAIASKSKLLAEDFIPVSETVPMQSRNQTRFALIGRPSQRFLIKKLLRNPEQIASSKATSVCIHPGKDRKGLLLEVLSLISVSHSCNMLSIHSRPDSQGGFVFYFEIEGEAHSDKVSACLAALDDYCKVNTGNAAKSLVFGTYPRRPFLDPAINSICIVGGNGKMGQWLSTFFEGAGIQVLSIDIDSGEEDLKRIYSCDAVILSVPMSLLNDTAMHISKYCNNNCLIIENCSVKTNSIRTLETFFSNHETLGIHTMFGPSLSELKGQNIIITRTKNSQKKSVALENLFYKYGANLHYSDPEDHDRTVAYLQALCQFTSLGIALTMTESGKLMSDFEPFLTPNSRKVISSIERLLEQSETLTFDLQNENPYSEKVREDLIRSLEGAEKSLLDRKNFTQLIKKLRNNPLRFKQ